MKGDVGDGRVLAKKAKSAAVEGFDESMYNWDVNQTFDRKEFRDKKRMAKEVNPQWNWRERRAFALMDANGPKNPNLPDIPMPKLPKMQLPTIGGRGVIEVHAPEAQAKQVPETPSSNYTLVKKSAKIAPSSMSFNQFAGMVDDRLKDQKGFTTGSDLTNFQAWRGKEYAKYAKDPGSYT